MTSSVDLDRRSFLKWSAVVAGGSAAAGGLTAVLPQASANEAPGDGMADADATVWGACMVNCHCRCPLRFQVKDGVIVRVLPDNTGSDDEIGEHRIPACVRGRSIRHRIYHPDRLRTPLKRKEGTRRGDDQWEEISWDQALDEIAEKYKQILTDYGPESAYGGRHRAGIRQYHQQLFQWWGAGTLCEHERWPPAGLR
jgi:anaerobic dimethyl sulfoxide reductase subunit A